MSLSGTRLHGQAVKTQPSHGCNRGSNPLGVTKKTRTLLRPCFSLFGSLFCVSFYDPQQAARSRACARCKANPLGVTIQSISGTFRCPISFRDLTPVLRLALRPATGCTLARRALTVRRIPSKPVKNFGRFSAPDLSCLFRASSLCLSLRIASCKARHRRRPRRAALHACPAPRHRRP